MVNESYFGHMLRQKSKDTENKIKEKAYYVKKTVQTSIFQANHRLHHHKKRNGADNCISIAIALFIIVVSLFSATSWLFWLGIVSILSNAVLLIFSLSKNNGRKE
nr:hypothetical protein [Neobacillus jeddahensis]